jgi:thioredoxin reductase (NADPH)
LVVGGGNTTAKSALVAKAAGANEVILIHRRDSLRAYPAMVRRLGKEGVGIKYTTEIEEIRGNDKVVSVILKNNVTDEKSEMLIDWLVVCVGTEPDISLAREANMEIKENFVSVDNEMMTNRPGIFACGEIIGTDRHLISSVASGAYAGMAASKYLALDKVRKGEMFSGAINGKYADEYVAML